MSFRISGQDPIIFKYSFPIECVLQHFSPCWGYSDDWGNVISKVKCPVTKSDCT